MSEQQGPEESDRDFDAILRTIAETERGRWFLAEHARRHRVADTRTLLEAMGRIEKVVTGRLPGGEAERLRTDLADMSAAISRALAEFGDDELAAAASADLEGTCERAAAGILEAAERIQETAWTMREGGFDPALCDTLDERATEIYVAYEAQAAAMRSAAGIVGTLGFLRQRIGLMSRVWGVADVGTNQGEPSRPELTPADIDFVIVDDDQAAPPVSPDRARMADALARLDALSTRERLQLFT